MTPREEALVRDLTARLRNAVALVEKRNAQLYECRAERKRWRRRALKVAELSIRRIEGRCFLCGDLTEADFCRAHAWAAQVSESESVL